MLRVMPSAPTASHQLEKHIWINAGPTESLGSGFVAAPSLPVSNSSPFTQLTPGPSPEVSNSSEYTTFWRCGDLVVNSVVYHSLTLTVENGLCVNNTATEEVYQCGDYPISQEAYLAIVQGRLTHALANAIYTRKMIFCGAHPVRQISC